MPHIPVMAKATTVKRDEAVAEMLREWERERARREKAEAEAAVEAAWAKYEAAKEEGR